MSVELPWKAGLSFGCPSKRRIDHRIRAIEQSAITSVRTDCQHTRAAGIAWVNRMISPVVPFRTHRIIFSRFRPSFLGYNGGT